eukprot:gene3897-4864_t
MLHTPPPEKIATLYQLLCNSTEKLGTSTAVVIPTTTTTTVNDKIKSIDISYSKFLSDSILIANQLYNNGFKKDDVVSIILPNGYSILACFMGVTFSKCMVAPLNPNYTRDEFKFYLDDMGAKLIIVSQEIKNAIDAATDLNIKIWQLNESISDDGNNLNFSIKSINDQQPIEFNSSNNNDNNYKLNGELPEPSDKALFLHTSGTTSRPKGVPLTHQNITVSANNISRTFHLDEKDRSLVVMPLFHVHGLIGVTLSSLFAGSSLVVPPKFSGSQFFQQAKQFNVTWYSAVPTIHNILCSILTSNNNTNNSIKGQLRFIRSCSSSLAPSLLESMEELFGCPVVESYGMTEASHQMSSNLLPQDGKRLAGSVGVGTNVKVSIMDDDGEPLEKGQVGEICIKGENVMLGYHNNPQANIENFTKSGWFKTGDLGYLDENDYIILKGRKKEIINRGGEKISPLEVDHAMLELDSVSEAVCFGVPDEKYGEEIWAAVVPKDDCKNLTESDVINFLKGKSVAFKIPKKVIITDQLPKTASGKVQRRFVSEFFLKQSKN